MYMSELPEVKIDYVIIILVMSLSRLSLSLSVSPHTLLLQGGMPKLKQSRGASGGSDPVRGQHRGRGRIGSERGCIGSENVEDTPSMGAGLPACIWTKHDDIFITICAKPGAKQSCISEVSAEGVAVQVSAPPHEGVANTELCRVLARLLSVRKSCVSVDHGQRSRLKTVRITECALDSELVLRTLQDSIGKSL